MTVQVLRRRFTVDEYYLMAKVGILKEDDRVELIDGEIVEMAPIGRYHASSVDRLTWVLSQRVGQRAILRVQSPIHLGEHSEPQPDISLLRPQDDFYASGHLGPEDVLLLIEVADTSAEYDRRVKLPLYARAGIREFWLVDLTGNEVEVYRQPSSRGYRLILMPSAEDRLAPQVLPDVELTPQDILGS
ncbi:MAG: Uma2 family endonuclease [Dehalococcoidia bacterium]|nr:Uma2 family endonuclease [Dehalococcoidia bacterium]MSQ16969.1 Uma2 family endonuclease [Dehalococcoidia bacterium]